MTVLLFLRNGTRSGNFIESICNQFHKCWFSGDDPDDDDDDDDINDDINDDDDDEYDDDDDGDGDGDGDADDDNKDHDDDKDHHIPPHQLSIYIPTWQPH